jgi:hypothetical protein
MSECYTARESHVLVGPPMNVMVAGAGEEAVPAETEDVEDGVARTGSLDVSHVGSPIMRDSAGIAIGLW